MGKSTGVTRFNLAVGKWALFPTALAVCYRVLPFPGAASWNVGDLWQFTSLFLGWIGTFLPFALFAGGLTVRKPGRPSKTVMMALPLVVLVFGLQAYAIPLAEYQSRGGNEAEASSEVRAAPGVPGELRARRAFILENPPDRFSFRVSDPLERPPNWLTFLLHSPLVHAVFAVLAALIGAQSALITSRLSPLNRKNARWAIGLGTGLLFFFFITLGAAWVREAPGNSGILGAWFPLGVPVLELLVLTLFNRPRAGRVAPESPALGHD